MRRNIALYLGIGLSLVLGGTILLVGIVTGSAFSLAAVAGAGRGIHLGNVTDGKGWNAVYFSKINGEGGDWPDAVVFMSNQVYDIDRPTESPCHIEGVSVESEGKRIVWDYVQRLPPETKIIIRVYPSPGYFEGDHLVPDPVDYHCDWEQRRSVDDVADEICAIQRFNDENGLDGRWVGFLPANEPNREWYTRPWPTPQPTIQPQNQQAWTDMDAHFTAIYNYVKERCSANVLTPLMSQNLYAEGYRVNNKKCEER